MDMVLGFASAALKEPPPRPGLAPLETVLRINAGMFIGIVQSGQEMASALTAITYLTLRTPVGDLVSSVRSTVKPVTTEILNLVTA